MNHKDHIKQLVLKGHSRQEIAKLTQGLAPNTITQYFYQIVRALPQPEKRERERARVERTKVAAPGRHEYRRKFAERHILGPLHIRLGSRLLMARMQANMTLSEFSDHYGFSNRVTLSAMEQGFHDFTLLEIGRLADILGISLQELMRPPLHQQSPALSGQYS